MVEKPISWTSARHMASISFAFQRIFPAYFPHVFSPGYSPTSSDLSCELVSKSPPEGSGIAFLWSVNRIKSKKVTEID